MAFRVSYPDGQLKCDPILCDSYTKFGHLIGEAYVIEQGIVLYPKGEQPDYANNDSYQSKHVEQKYWQVLVLSLEDHYAPYIMKTQRQKCHKKSDH